MKVHIIRGLTTFCNQKKNVIPSAYYTYLHLNGTCKTCIKLYFLRERKIKIKISVLNLLYPVISSYNTAGKFPVIFRSKEETL